MTRRSRWFRVARLLVAALVGAGAMLATDAQAWWDGVQRISAGHVTAGELTVSVEGFAWQQTTPGVADPASGEDAASLAAFVAGPGDTGTLVQRVVLTMTGDNLNATLTLKWAITSVDPSVVATFVVTDADGVQVAPAAGLPPLVVGTPVVLPGLTPAATPTRVYTVTATMTVLSVPEYVDPVSGALEDSAPTSLSLPRLGATIQQTRPSPDPGSS